MSTIRTAQLGAGNTDALGTVLPVYTVAAGTHARLRRTVLRPFTAIGQVDLFVTTTGGVTTYLQRVAAAPLNVPINDAGDVVLEAGDTLNVQCAVGTRAAVVASGTVYDN